MKKLTKMAALTGTAQPRMAGKAAARAGKTAAQAAKTAARAGTTAARGGKTAAEAGAAAPTGTLKAARTLVGEDAVDVLTRQHRQIKLGFLKAALPGALRRRNFDRLMRLLAVHEAAEEAHVHPVARRALRHGQELAARRRHEEKEAKQLLVALWRTGPDGRGYLRQLNQVRRAVTRHAAREEREEFAALRDAVSATRLRLLGAEVKLTQAYAPTRPHRWVNNEAMNKLAAPFLGPLDRARDGVRHRMAS